jgi:hypothetical protein
MKLFIFILIGLIILFLNLSKSNIIQENYINLIDNGSFEKGEYSKNNVGSNLGNTIIRKINPGKTSYVLRQTGIIGGKIKKTRYQISVKVLSGAEYVIELWSLHTNNWDGNKNLFNITMYRDCGDSEILIHEGKKIGEKMINNELWEKRNLIFTIPNNSNGKIDIYIGYDPKNNKGYRFITDIDLQRHYPLISDLPIKDNLILYVSSNKKESFEDNNMIWNDLSMNGRDIKFEDKVSLTNNHLVINKFKGIGSKSNIIVPDQNAFSIIWSCTMKEFTKGTFLEIFANNKANIGIKIHYENKVGIDNFITIMIGHNVYKYKIGISQKKVTYILSKKNKNIFFYIDGFKIKPETNNKKLLEDLEINSKSMILNPNKKLSFNIDFIIIYSQFLSPNNINSLTNYIETTRVLTTKEFCRPNINDRNCSCSIDSNSQKVNISVKPHLISEINKYKSTYIESSNNNEVISDTISEKKCPFNITCKESPCSTLECQGADWSSFQVSDKCKRVINSYCKKNKDTVCNQLKEKKYTQQKSENNSCSSSRNIISKLKEKINYNTKNNNNNKSFVNNSNKDSNDISSSNKSKCPDMSKYIRKDQIPCWGCNLK